MNFTEAKKLFDTARNKETGKPIANNTRIIKVDDKTYAVRLHETNVVTFHKNGKITLDSGGWRTQTTKERINDAINEYNQYLIQDKGMWYLATGWNDPHRTLYQDGITINTKTKKITNAPSLPEMAQREEIKKRVDKMVSKYIKGYIEHIKEHGLNDPGPGDCWICAMEDKAGVDHLLSHFEENYYVPRLLWNAINERGYTQPDFIWYTAKMDATKPNSDNYFTKHALHRYFQKRKQTLIEELIKREKNQPHHTEN